MSHNLTETADRSAAALPGLLERLQTAVSEVQKVVVGQEQAVSELFIGLLSGGHVLIEGTPGLGKTLLVRTLGTVCGMKFSRIQFTPDLMPADITGTVALYHDEHGAARTRFQPGPVFAQMVLTDEINRATPKTQSALLEAMQEHTVTVAGQQHALPRPFFVLATQNPIDMEGTYTLPEAQVDRFICKVIVPFPAPDVLDRVLQQTTESENVTPVQMLTPEEILELQVHVRDVVVPQHVRAAVVQLVTASQPERPEATPEVRRFVSYGVSPRGAQSMILGAKALALMQGRFNVAFSDLAAVALPVLRHRIQLNFEAEAEQVTAEDLISQLASRFLNASR